MRQDLSPYRTGIEVGVLHLGSEVHGVRRYGRMIARALDRRPRVAVTEREAVFIAQGRRAGTAPVSASRAMSKFDVVLVSYSRGLWTASRLRLWQIVCFHLGVRRRSVVVLHDVYGPGGRRRMEWWALALNLLLARATIIHGEHDREVIKGMPRWRQAVTIPHFIEPRPVMERESAREALGIASGPRILAVVGWIHRTKNYELAIRVLAELGRGFGLWLIGTSPTEDRSYLDRLEELARDLRVADRMLVTGYVSDAEMDLRLGAVDVGLCLYHDTSASGSMSSILAARRPVVAADLPFARDLQAQACDAVTIASDLAPSAVASTIARCVSDPPDRQCFDRVLASRSPEAIAVRYEAVLRSASCRPRGHRA